MENVVFTQEEMHDIAEMRDLVCSLPDREIVKGMAMFEAGYKTGFFDGARNAAKDEEKKKPSQSSGAA